MHRLLSLGLLAATVRVAYAQPDPIPVGPELPTEEPQPEPEPEPAAEGPSDEFGPLLLIERIEIGGNTATQDEIIERALPITVGDVLRASDKRLADARFKILALGYFREVTLAMQKGSARGKVILRVDVVERGTIVLNRLWFGTTTLSPYWFGADLTERNLFGLGVAIGGGIVYASHGNVDGSRNQWAGELRAADASLLGTRLGLNGALTLVHGSEAYRVAGDDTDPGAGELLAFPYRRFGGRTNLTYDVTALTRLSASMRIEAIKADLPVAPTRMLPDGRIVAIDLHLEPDNSTVTTIGFTYDRDTRPDPILPHSGYHIGFSAELGAAFSDYQFATLFGRYEHYWGLFDDKHAIAIKLAAGVVVGDAPRFDRIHVADVDRMLTPRALGLVLSAAEPLDILGTRSDKPTYGDLGGSATVEYAIQLWRGKGRNRVYGGDAFFGVGLWGLAETADLRARDASLGSSLPLDIYIDAGVRLDTDIGIFELTVANGLGRLR
jgi:outer membrane protein insertion porin family